jgi:hypothetical protein
MNLIRLLPLACLLWAGAASAQSDSACPTLPANSGLSWQKLDGSGFTFCKALRDSDGSQAFAVTIASESPFKPRRGDRVTETVIDGRETYWYRSEVAGAPDVLVRETLVELDRDRVAHISFRASGEQALAETMRMVEGIGFQGVQLSSK